MADKEIKKNPFIDMEHYFGIRRYGHSLPPVHDALYVEEALRENARRVEEERRCSMAWAELREFRRQLDANRMEIPHMSEKAKETILAQQIQPPTAEQIQAEAEHRRRTWFALHGEGNPTEPGPTCRPAPPDSNASMLYKHADDYICRHYDGKSTCGRHTCMHPRPEKK